VYFLEIELRKVAGKLVFWDEFGILYEVNANDPYDVFVKISICSPYKNIIPGKYGFNYFGG
jgi:hypothetical protein